MIRRSNFSPFFRRSKVSINIRSLEFHEIKTIFQEIESFNNAFKVLKNLLATSTIRRSKVSINIRSLEFHEIKTIFQEIESFNNAFKVLKNLLATSTIRRSKVENNAFSTFDVMKKMEKL
jgi:dsDNA-specific endonuclease/ATPase MutS2